MTTAARQPHYPRQPAALPSGPPGQGAAPYSLSYTSSGKLCLKGSYGACIWWVAAPDSLYSISSQPATSLATLAGYATVLTDGMSSLLLMGDGNLVFSSGSTTLWSSGTANAQPGAYQLAITSTGDLLLSSKSNGRAVWHSNTVGAGKGPFKAMVQGKKLLLVDSTGAVTWSK
jgi:hypothetical protein